MRDEAERPQSLGEAPPAAVRAQLARILMSPAFIRAPRLRRFLTRVVDEALAGRLENLKEYSLGVDVFDRGEAFDPRADPIVRVDARRLRGAIGAYYNGPGAGDPVEIELPTGSYLPVFRLRPGARGRRPTLHREAYELYLRGRRLLNATRPERMAEALRLMGAATDRDPGFAGAWAAIAEAHFVSAVFGLAAPLKALSAARDAAQTALQADPDLAAGHAELARVSAALDHDFTAAGAGFERALALDPGAAAVRQARALWLLAPLGRLDEAVTEVEALLDQRPYSRKLRVDYARLLAFARRFDEAIGQLELILEFEPDYPGAPWLLAIAYERAGRVTQARALHERQVRQFQAAHPLVERWLEAAHALWNGAPDTARAVIESMDRTARPAPVAASVMTDAWMRLGDSGRALDWLELQADQRMLRVLHLAVDPDYDSLRGEPRFDRLLARVGVGPG